MRTRSAAVESSGGSEKPDGTPGPGVAGASDTTSAPYHGPTRPTHVNRASRAPRPGWRAGRRGTAHGTDSDHDLPHRHHLDGADERTAASVDEVGAGGQRLAAIRRSAPARDVAPG